MARILIVGIDSAIGGALAEALVAAGEEVIGTTRRQRSGRSVATIRLDLAVDDIADVPLPPVDAAVICAAMARYADCREQPQLARTVNVTAPAQLAERLSREGARTILLSTSAVFDCQSPFVPADRPPAPISAYGALKAEAEARILQLGRGASVLRLTKVLTPDMPLFVGWIAALARGERVSAFEDLTFSPILLSDVVQAFTAILEDASGGILQVSGAGDMSYVDAARHLARRLGVDPGLVEATRAVDSGIPEAEVPRYTSLDTSRLTAATRWSPPAPAAVLDAVFGARLAQAQTAR